MRSKKRLGPLLLFLLPALTGLFLFKLYPIGNGILQSLYTTSFLTGGQSFVALQNYITLFQDPVFWNSLKVTLLFNIIINPLQVVLAFLLALLLNARIKRIAWFRSIHFVPVAISVPTACMLWNIMLSPEQGVVNSILAAFGLPEQPFLGSSAQALGSIIAIASWKGVGYWALFLLAGLQEVPASLMEASSLDGAGRWRQLIHIIYPMMKRPLTFIVVSITTANFLLFSPMYILTKGGPENSTNVLMLESFNSAFLYSDLGRSSAIVVILLLLTLTAVAAQFKWLKASH